MERKRVVKVIKVGGQRIEGDVDLHIDTGIEDLETRVEVEREELDDGTLVMKIHTRKEGGKEGNPLARAAGVSGAIDDLREEVGRLVRRAREQGYTWGQVGDALGITKQAAWERFSGEE